MFVILMSMGVVLVLVLGLFCTVEVQGAFASLYRVMFPKPKKKENTVEVVSVEMTHVEEETKAPVICYRKCDGEKKEVRESSRQCRMIEIDELTLSPSRQTTRCPACSRDGRHKISHLLFDSHWHQAKGGDSIDLGFVDCGVIVRHCVYCEFCWNEKPHNFNLPENCKGPLNPEPEPEPKVKETSEGELSEEEMKEEYEAIVGKEWGGGII